MQAKMNFFKDGELQVTMEREMFSHTDVAMTMGLADLLLRCCLSIDSCSVQVSFAITTQSVDSYGHIGSTQKLTHKI